MGRITAWADVVYKGAVNLLSRCLSAKNFVPIFDCLSHTYAGVY